jgi:hypothetical protein
MIFLPLFLAGCASESALLINGSGQTLQCNNQGWGWLGAPIAVHNQHDCIDKARANGYREILPGEKVETAAAAAAK